jgi:hypothetical protein
VIDTQVAPSKPRWKVQLELAPAEIALVYRQGLARGAEVCRRGTEDWRPLVTTPELRPALVDRSSWPDLRPSAPDSAVTQPLPTHVVPAELVPVHVPDAYSDVPAAVFTPAPVVRHARSAELSLVAVLSFAATLGAALLAEQASHWTEVRAAIATPAPPRAARPFFAGVTQPSVWSSALSSTAPVVMLHDLPLERAGAGFKGTGRSAPSSAPPSGGRTDFARALGQAARSARSCGEGPVHTQVVATFAPSGVPRAVHFGSTPPPAALRSCVLSAVARSRVAPFEGDPVTVSKTLSW